MVERQRYRHEIFEQPAVLSGLLRDERSHIEAIAQQIKRVRPVYALLAARGSSDNAARYAQYILGVRNQMVCGLATPSVTTVYDSPPNMRESLTIGISQSGQSPDIIRVVAEAKSQGALTLAMTNHSFSPLAQVAEHVIGLRAGTESAVPATKTYTAELMVIAMLSAALLKSKGPWSVLEQVPGAVQEALDTNSNISGIEEFADMKQVVVVGRGFNYATAFEIALKISETSSVLALPFSSADFLHGPVAVLGPKTPVILIAPRGQTDTQIPRLLEAVKERKAPLIIISDDDALLDQSQLALRLPQMPEWASPLCAVIAGQLFSLALAQAKTQETDEPPGLSKVTLTY